MCLAGREQCKVLFPYEAQNEDELSIKEGEIVNIITKVNRFYDFILAHLHHLICLKTQFASRCTQNTLWIVLQALCCGSSVQECADAGWWMGEIGGRQGVFPDNFVKLLEVEKEVSSARGHTGRKISVCCEVRSWESLKDLTHSCCVSASVCVLRDQRNLLLPARRQPNTPQVHSHRRLLLLLLCVCFYVLREKIKSLWTLTCREKVGGQEGSSRATWAPASERPGSRYSPDHFGPLQTAFSLQLLQQL